MHRLGAQEDSMVQKGPRDSYYGTVEEEEDDGRWSDATDDEEEDEEEEAAEEASAWGTTPLWRSGKRIF